MDGSVTFVIPVRHHLSVPDGEWPSFASRPGQTVASVSAQRSGNWTCVVVANSDTPLPIFPATVQVVRIEERYVPLPDKHDVGQSAWDAAARADKGRRVALGLVRVRPHGHVMVVDFDDLVSREIAGFVAKNPGVPGWFVDSGYVYDGGRLLYKVKSGFNGICGTSLIVRSSLLSIPATEQDIDEAWASRWLGSHVRLRDDLAASGAPLVPLPLPGAVYRVGYRGQSSGHPTIRGLYFRKKLLATRPLEFASRLRNLRLQSMFHHQFFGGRGVTDSPS